MVGMDMDRSRAILKLLLEKKEAEGKGFKQPGHNAPHIAEEIGSSESYVRTCLSSLYKQGLVRGYRGYYNITDAGIDALNKGEPISLKGKKNVTDVIPKNLLVQSDYCKALIKDYALVAETYLNLTDEDVIEKLLPIVMVYCIKQGYELPAGFNLTCNSDKANETWGEVDGYLTYNIDSIICAMDWDAYAEYETEKGRPKETVAQMEKRWNEKKAK